MLASTKPRVKTLLNAWLGRLHLLLCATKSTPLSAQSGPQGWDSAATGLFWSISTLMEDNRVPIRQLIISIVYLGPIPFALILIASYSSPVKYWFGSWHMDILKGRAEATGWNSRNLTPIFFINPVFDGQTDWPEDWDLIIVRGGGRGLSIICLPPLHTNFFLCGNCLVFCSDTDGVTS